MEEGGDFDEHIKMMHTLVKEAQEVGAVVSDSNSGPSSWTHFCLAGTSL